MNYRRQVKCQSWAAHYATYTHIEDKPGEVVRVAKEQAQLRASDYTRTFDTPIPNEEYPEWENVFVEAFIAAHNQKVQKCRHCGKDDLPLNQESGLCVRCVIDLEQAAQSNR